MRGGLHTYKITVAANGTQRRSIRGNFIFVKSASFAIEVEIAENQVGGKSGERYSNAMRQGEKWHSDGEFDQIFVNNLQSSEMTVELIVGFGEYAREVPERVSTADVNLTTLGTIAAANTPQQLVAERTFRKRLFVQARIGNTSTIRVAESAAQITAGAYIELIQGAGALFESKSAIFIQSATMGDIAVAVEEYWND